MNLIQKIIEEPLLTELACQADPEALVRLIRHIGIEDGVELLAFAPESRLVDIFDEAFWKNDTPGEAEQFDAEEFALWLEILHEQSSSTAQRIIAAMNNDLLTLAMAEHLLVVDYEALALRMQEADRPVEDDLLEKVLDTEYCLEWDGYLIISQKSRSWDSLIALLVNLDREDHDRVERLLKDLLFISTEYIEDNGGLYSVLKQGEMLEVDLAAEREERKAAQGFVAPETAAAFLRSAAETPMDELIGAVEHDYLTRMYFRTFDPDSAVSENKRVQQRDRLFSAIRCEMPELYQELLDAEVIVSSEGKALSMDSETCTGVGAPQGIRHCLREMAQIYPERYDSCLVELHYLANILIAAKSSDSRKMRSIEAAENTLQLCHQGLARMLKTAEPDHENMMDMLMKEGPVKLFRIGWRELH